MNTAYTQVLCQIKSGAANCIQPNFSVLSKYGQFCLNKSKMTSKLEYRNRQASLWWEQQGMLNYDHLIQSHSVFANDYVYTHSSLYYIKNTGKSWDCWKPLSLSRVHPVYYVCLHPSVWMCLQGSACLFLTTELLGKRLNQLISQILFI